MWNFGARVRCTMVALVSLLAVSEAAAQLAKPDEAGGVSVRVPADAAEELRRAIATPGTTATAETSTTVKIDYSDLLYAKIVSGAVDRSAAAAAIELFTVEFIQTYSDKCESLRPEMYPRVQAVSPVPSSARGVWVAEKMRAPFERYRERVGSTRERVPGGAFSMANLEQSVAVMEQFLAREGCADDGTRRLYENLHRLVHGYDLLDLIEPITHLNGPIGNPDGYYRVSSLGISRISAEGPMADGSYTIIETKVERGVLGASRSPLGGRGRWYPERQQMHMQFRYAGACDNWTDPMWGEPLEPKLLGFDGVSAWGAADGAPARRVCTVARVNPNTCQVVGCRRWSDEENGPGAVIVTNYNDAVWAYESYFGQ